jgi:hypothetical protein
LLALFRHAVSADLLDNPARETWEKKRGAFFFETKKRGA